MAVEIHFRTTWSGRSTGDAAPCSGVSCTQTRCSPLLWCTSADLLRPHNLILDRHLFPRPKRALAGREAQLSSGGTFTNVLQERGGGETSVCLPMCTRCTVHDCVVTCVAMLGVCRHNQRVCTYTRTYVRIICTCSYVCTYVHM